jgi:A/G-specific adenine glycosylase
VRTRASKGLLGGMTEFFGSDWGAAAPDAGAMARAGGATLERIGQVEHVFTHFALTLDVYRGRSAKGAAPEGCRWVTREKLAQEPIPNVFAKVWEAASEVPPRQVPRSPR